MPRVDAACSAIAAGFWLSNVCSAASVGGLRLVAVNALRVLFG